MGSKKTEQQHGIIREKRVKWNKRKSSSRGNKIKKSKVEQEEEQQQL